MAVIDEQNRLPVAPTFARIKAFRAQFNALVADMLPKGLYTRALLIIIAPFILLESFLAFAFMERHWNQVTRRLSESTARDIAAIVEIYDASPKQGDNAWLRDIAEVKLGLPLMQIMPPGDLPATQFKQFFQLLDRALTDELALRVKRPFWIDTVGSSRHVEIRIKHERAVLRFVALRSQVYASNSHIFLVWMVGTSVVLLTAAILLLGNQIRPILRLADAADAFGKGREFPEDFKPRGAREVRQAAEAFLEMRDRIRQHVDQRTTMLAGVSHDLRTVLTRFKLELALLGDREDVEALRQDVNEMQHMLEDYLAFTRGDGGEVARQTDLALLLDEVHEEAQFYSTDAELLWRRPRRPLMVPLKRQAIKRALVNLITNAARFGDKITIRAGVDRAGWLSIDIEDDGPGIPEAERENVFKPFYRLDHARNQDVGNTGLGLAIARDIARGHGGDIVLGVSHLGGLQATLRIPI